MKIQIASDLHCEHNKDGGRALLESLDATGVDVLVLAGDICSLRDYHRAKQVFSTLTHKYKDVVYVHGNHEYYGTKVSEALINSTALENGLKNLHILHPGRNITIDNQRFIGGTLWFKDDPNNFIYEHYLSDFSAIQGFKPWVYQQSSELIAYLESELEETDVVVTHHLPSDLCTHPKFKGSAINRFFVNSVERLILEKKPKLWVHGHTHEAVDVVLGSTRIVANPKGYPHEGISVAFNPSFTIDV